MPSCEPRSCEPYCTALPQYVADGEPATPAHAALRRHLRECAACRGQLARLREVETALRAYPTVAAPPELAATTMARIEALNAAPHEEWRWLPWNLWLPALVLICAAAIVALALPDALLVDSLIEAGADWSASLEVWLAALSRQTETSSFWAVWLGVFVSAAGLGLTVALSGWRHVGEGSHRALQARVEHVTAWLDSLVGRAS